MGHLQEFSNQLLNWIKNIPGIAPVIINLILGVALLFFGYKLFRYWLFLLGAQVGYTLGIGLATWLKLNAFGALIVCVLFILAMGLLYWSSIRFSFALAGFSIASLFARHYGGFFTDDITLFTLLAGIAGAILSYLFVRVFLIIGTAAYGALITSDAIFALINNGEAGEFIFSNLRFSPNATMPLVITTIGLGLVAFWYQYKSSHGGSSIKVFF